MNKFLLIVLSFLTIPVLGQYKVKTVQPDFIQQGDMTFGGNISFSSQSFERSSGSRTVLSLSPSASYFFWRNFSAGFAAYINNTWISSSTTTDWGIGPEVRYYFSVKRFAPFAGLGAAYGINSSSESGDEFTTTRYIITAGTDYFLTRDISLEFTLNYMFINERYPDRYRIYFSNLDFRSTQISFAAGINIFL